MEANADKCITSRAKVSKIYKSRYEMEIDLEEEQRIKSYKVTLNIDIENTDKIGNIQNHHKRN